MHTSLERRTPEGATDASKASRQIVYGFVFKLTVYAVCALPAALRNGRPLAKYFDTLGLICVVAAFGCGLVALMLRQMPGDRALNHWDQAIGFAGIYFLSRWLVATAIGVG